MITSTSNIKIKRLVSLKRKRKLRDAEKVFLVEGLRMFREVPDGALLEVYVTQAFYDREKSLIEKKKRNSGVSMEILADTVFEYVADTKTPQGILCVARQADNGEECVSGGDNPFVLVLDNLQDPGNLGTIVRAAEAAGVTGILMSRDCVDIYNPKTIRSTMGSVFRVPFAYSDDLAGSIRKLKEKKIKCYAAHLEGACAYDKADYRGSSAVLIGNEGNGLRKEIAGCADQFVKIPMCGQVESLNAAVAASVLMFETARQRR